MTHSNLIGIMADSHDNKHGVLAATRLFRDRQIGLFLHAGDYIAPFNAGWMADIGVPMIGVFGNLDGEKFGLQARFTGLRICLTMRGSSPSCFTNLMPSMRSQTADIMM